jgi:hypothetical protein
MFEAYQALRVANQIWSDLTMSDRRALTLLLSARWLAAAFENDVPALHLTRSLLDRARDTELEQDIQVSLPDGVAIRFPVTELKNLNELTDAIYSALAPAVRLYHYHYGTAWRLRDGDTQLHHARELLYKGPGKPVPDTRSLLEAGVRPGARLRVELLDPPRDMPTPPDASP